MLPERKPQILVVDDEVNLRRVLTAQLMRDGYDVHAASDGVQGLETLREHHIDLLITDLKMPRMDGMELLRQALQLEPRLPVVMITAHGTVDTAVQALKTGAFDYITKPFDQAEVRAIVHKALQTHAVSTRDVRGRDATTTPGPVLVGLSPVIVALNTRLGEVARQATPVVVVGEVGTGKELVARAIHDGSTRRERPFIKVNCAAIPPEVIASELFGVASASTTTARPGRLELAAGGSLFLDEVAAIPHAVQLQLANAVRSGSFERLGGVGRLPFDARVIAASRIELAELVEDGGLCPELAALLTTPIVRLPPLRERREDIPSLCGDLIAGFNARFGKQVTAVSDDASELLSRYSWPGNIRELENALEQAVLLCEGDVISPPDLPLHLAAEEPPEDVAAEDRGLKAQVKAITARVERQLINKALQQTQGNVTHAARLLKISRKGLQLKMKELGLRERDE